MTDYGVNFEQSINAAIRIDVGGAADAYVGGINKLKPYGLTNTVNDVMEFRKGFSSKYIGTGDLGVITYGGNDLGTDAGQDYLRAMALNKNKVANIWFYKNLTDFFCPDTANDPESTMQISKHDVAEVDPNGVYTFTGEAILNGAPATFKRHHTSSTIVIAQDAGGDTLTDATSGTFVADGIVAGDTIILDGVTESADDFTQHIVLTVAPTVITLVTALGLTAQLTGASFTIHSGRF